ncbi:hypothetical protein NL676_035026 [Syzygium grande]|nr:hypothetical protein NL676_035026 [Syzygium grande]
MPRRSSEFLSSRLDALATNGYSSTLQSRRSSAAKQPNPSEQPVTIDDICSTRPILASLKAASSERQDYTGASHTVGTHRDHQQQPRDTRHTWHLLQSIPGTLPSPCPTSKQPQRARFSPAGLQPVSNITRVDHNLMLHSATIEDMSVFLSLKLMQLK